MIQFGGISADENCKIYRYVFISFVQTKYPNTTTIFDQLISILRNVIKSMIFEIDYFTTKSVLCVLL